MAGQMPSKLFYDPTTALPTDKQTVYYRLTGCYQTIGGRQNCVVLKQKNAKKGESTKFMFFATGWDGTLNAIFDDTDCKLPDP